MDPRPQRPDRGPSRKQIGTRSIQNCGQVNRLTLPAALDAEPFPREAGAELIVELVTAENGYQHVELHPDPEDLEGQPAHERALAER